MLAALVGRPPAGSVRAGGRERQLRSGFGMGRRGGHGPLLWVRCNEQASMRRDKNSLLSSAVATLWVGLSGAGVEGNGPAVARRGLRHGCPRPGRHCRCLCAARAACLVVSFSPRCRPTRNCAAGDRNRSLRQTCHSLVLELQRQAICAHNTNAFQPAGEESWKAAARSEAAVPSENIVSHAALLRGMAVRARIVRSWMQRKPVQPAGALFSMRVRGERNVNAMFACTYSPDFPVEAVVRAEPLLRERALHFGGQAPLAALLR